MIKSYNDYIFEGILNDILAHTKINENIEDEQPVEFVWDINKAPEKNRLVNLLKRLPKKDIIKYLKRTIGALKKPSHKNVMASILSVFLGFLSLADIKEADTSLYDEVIELVEDKEVVETPIRVESSFYTAQEFVKAVEGDYSSDRGDTGNFVNVKGGKRFIGSKYGISAPILMNHLGRIPTQQDMKDLSYKEASAIYKKKYWDKQNINKIYNQSIATLLYDGCVNQGISGTKRVLRQSLRELNVNIGDENPFSDKYIDIMNNLDQEELFTIIKKNRENRYRSARTFKRHGNGWLTRLNQIKFSE